MDHASTPGWLNDAIVFLVAAGIVVPFFHRARIGAVLGFLIIGLCVGPNGFGRLIPSDDWVRLLTIEDPENVARIGEWGVVFLLFLLGLESSVGKLWDLRRYVFGVGVLQVGLSAVAIGGVMRLAGVPSDAAVVLGLCLALSSTAIVMQVLVEDGRVSTMTGRIALAVLLFQDLMVVPILFIVGMLGSAAGFDVNTLAVTLGLAVAAIAGIMILGRFVLRPLLRYAAQTGSRDLIMAISLLIVVGASGATGAAGLSTALGAFLAGMLLSESEYRHQVEVDLEPFKGLLLGLFFMTVGMSVDPVGVFANAPLILAGLVGLLVIKAIMFFAAAAVFRVALPMRSELALLLAQGGEFALVVIGLARAKQVIPADLANAALAVTVLSMMVTPLIAHFARRIGRKLEERAHAARAPIPDHDLSDHVIIGGCGRVGTLIAQALEDENVPYICFDTDGDNVARMRADKRPVYFGDASRVELLEKVGGAKANAFVVTLNNKRAAERMVSAARRVNRRALIFARAADTPHAARLVKLGAVGVIPETVEASLQLAARLLESLDLPDEVVTYRLNKMRAIEVARLDEAELGG